MFVLVVTEELEQWDDSINIGLLQFTLNLSDIAFQEGKGVGLRLKKQSVYCQSTSLYKFSTLNY